MQHSPKKPQLSGVCQIAGTPVTGKGLSQDHGVRYCAWQLADDGTYRYFESAVVDRQVRREGHWLLQTEKCELSAQEAVRAYQCLGPVEGAFRSMTDVIEMRSIWHRTDSRVRAHVQVAWLALAVDRVLQREFKAKDIGKRGREAWEVLQSVKPVDFRINGPLRKPWICSNHRDARRILEAVEIKLESPQGPKTGSETVR